MSSASTFFSFSTAANADAEPVTSASTSGASGSTLSVFLDEASRTNGIAASTRESAASCW